MSVISLCVLACALAMDAFAVSLCKGFSVKHLQFKHYIIVGIYFGGFQALMPAIGYFIGAEFGSFIQQIDYIIAFVLLALIGLKMIKESQDKHQDNDTNLNQFGFKPMILLAIATSIDALAVGVSLAFLDVNMPLSITLIGVITFVFCVIALKIGNVFGIFLKDKAELFGGIVLIALGLKIFIEHFLES